jgi:hypothetical protein
MSESNLLQWLADFLDENPRIESQFIEHITECDSGISQDDIEEALDDFKNNH